MNAQLTPEDEFGLFIIILIGLMVIAFLFGAC